MGKKHNISKGISDQEREERRISLWKLAELGRLEPSYQDYMRSEDWKERAEEFKDKAGNKCSLCGSIEKIQVHHKHYRSLGFEKEEDIIVVCDTCHKKFHNIMAKEKKGKLWGLKDKKYTSEEENQIDELRRNIMNKVKVKNYKETNITNRERQGKKYTEEEKDKLKKEFEAGTSIETISSMLQRSDIGIITKLNGLGLISDEELWKKHNIRKRKLKFYNYGKNIILEKES